MLTAAAILLLGASYPLISRLAGGAEHSAFLAAFFGFATLIGLYTSAAFAAVAGLFATEVRYSGVSLAVNIASPLFGSTAPLLAAWLIQSTGVESGFQSFGTYVIALFLLAMLAIRRLDHGAFTGWGDRGENESRPA